MGGIRGVLPSRKILIDNSFQARLAQAREDFHFDLSLTEKDPQGQQKRRES